MISRLLKAGAVSLALLFASSVCLAQESAEPDSGAAPGRASIGGALGLSQFIADADYSKGAQPRPAFSGAFRYVINDWLRWQVSPGHTWTAYKNSEPAPFPDPNFPADSIKNDYITQIVPISIQMQYLLRGPGWLYHIGLGPGIYRVWVENHRKVLKDPDTRDLHRGLYPGVSGQVGAERFMSGLPSTSVELTVAGHWIFCEKDEQFPNGYNSFLASVEARIGVNYYFSLPRMKPKTELPTIPGGS